MPLLKRKPFALVETPKDLEPHDSVYQVRFTKEIFLDYRQYLNRINLYRQRVWTCKSTGKSNLTYEEALVSEKDAIEKVQELPDELVAPALQIIQFSMLPLKDLADTIAKELQNHHFVGDELYGKKDGDLYSCRVLKVVEDAGKTKFEIGWLDRNRKITEHSVLHREDCVRKKSPFSRNLLKTFVRESTCQSFPWLLHQKLAKKHGISTEPPKELQRKFSFHNGKLVGIKKTNDDDTGLEGVKESGRSKKLKLENGNSALVQNGQEDCQPAEEPIKYPIDDLLVQPGPDDPVFTSRPIPSREFNVPMDCVADLLMVWDFCFSFGRLLHMSPFPLEDFENGICHKDSNVVLIVETHSALLRLLIKDGHEYLSAIEKKKRKPKITLVTWTEYICDFLEMINNPELCSCISTIRRGHYGLLDVNAKLKILQELVNQVVGTDMFRGKLDEHIEERNELGATRREKALEYSRKIKEEKEILKGDADVHHLGNGHVKENGEGDSGIVANENPCSEVGGHVPDERNGEAVSSQENNLLQNSDNTLSRKIQKQQDNGARLLADKADNSFLGEAPKLLRNGRRPEEKQTKEQRKEYFEREIEKRTLRSNPLGKDRDYSRYWWFRRDGRIFVETSDFKEWGYYSSKEEFDALMGSLNCKGVRERALQNQLQKSYAKICCELQRRSKDQAHKVAMEEAAVRRSTRVRAPPRENPANAFLRYVNRWKED